jgi:hypothetical protein
MTQLYKIADEYQETLNSLMDEDGLINEMAIAKLDEITGDFNQKGVAIAKYISNIDADLEAIKTEKERLAKRQAVMENRVKWMNEYLKGNMERTGITEICCPYFSIKIKKSPPSVDILDRNQIPEHYLKTKTVVSEDKLKMREDMKNGLSIQGVRLIQNTWLDIR